MNNRTKTGLVTLSFLLASSNVANGNEQDRSKDELLLDMT